LLLNQRVGLVRPNEQKLQNFFEAILFSNEFYDYCQETSGSGDKGNISPNKINEHEIPLQLLTILKNSGEYRSRADARRVHLNAD
jgi:hypothetical protein